MVTMEYMRYSRMIEWCVQDMVAICLLSIRKSIILKLCK